MHADCPLQPSSTIIPQFVLTCNNGFLQVQFYVRHDCLQQVSLVSLALFVSIPPPLTRFLFAWRAQSPPNSGRVAAPQGPLLATHSRRPASRLGASVRWLWQCTGARRRQECAGRNQADSGHCNAGRNTMLRKAIVPLVPVAARGMAPILRRRGSAVATHFRRDITVGGEGLPACCARGNCSVVTLCTPGASPSQFLTCDQPACLRQSPRRSRPWNREWE